MLKVYFGHYPNEISNTSVYFDNTFKKEWLLEPFAKEVIKGIDGSNVLDNGVIDSPVFGLMPASKLSGGAKTLLLINKQPRKVFNASNCGDNCAKYLLKIAEEKDITVTLHHFMRFGKKFELTVINDKKKEVVNNSKDFLLIADKYLRGESDEG